VSYVKVSVNWKWIRRLLAGVLTFAAIFALWRAIAELPDAASLWPVPFRLGSFSFAVLLGMVQMLVAAGCFQDFTPSIRARGVPAPSIFLLSQTAKYVPGRIWAPAMQRLLIGDGASTKNIIAANMAVLCCVVSAQVVGAISCAVYFIAGLPAAALILAIVISLLGVLMRILAGLILRIGPSWMPEMKPERMALRALWWTVILAFTGALAWVFVYAVWLGFPIEESIALYGISSVSILIGLLSFLPAGFGVREAVFVWLAALPWPLPAESLAPVAIHGRIWLLAVDIASAVMGLVWLVVAKTAKVR